MNAENARTPLLATNFSVPKMDCPTEERMVRMAMEPFQDVLRVEVNLAERTVTLTHRGDPGALRPHMERLGLGAVLEHSSAVDFEVDVERSGSGEAERKVLIYLLLINGVMFVGELLAGIVAGSTGLLADSLDMLGDAMVYGVSLYAVGAGVRAQNAAAKVSGIIQLALAAGVLFEVARRAAFGGEAASFIMMGAASLALAANLWCVWLLRSHREGGVHMKASWIFSTNDALANLGVILAGVLVLATGSIIPDLVIGVVIAGLVTRGALRILRLSSVSAPG